MNKRVISVSRTRDIIAEDIDELVDIFESGKNYIMRKPSQKSFETLLLGKNTIGIIWWISKNYEGFIDKMDFFKDYADHHVFSFDATSYSMLDDQPKLDMLYKQAYAIRDHFSLLPVNMQFKVKLRSMKERAKLVNVIKTCAVIGISRLQVEFSASDISDVNKASLASFISSVARKNKVIVNSCRFAKFSEDNVYIGSEPCISGIVMEEILGVKMVKNKDNYVPMGCNCHKHIELLGVGTKFNPEVDKLRQSDVNKGFDSIKVDENGAIVTGKEATGVSRTEEYMKKAKESQDFITKHAEDVEEEIAEQIIEDLDNRATDEEIIELRKARKTFMAANKKG